MNMTPALEDYLEAVLIVTQNQGLVRVKDLASFLRVKAPSVIQALNHLKAKGLVHQEPYGSINLTEAGRSHAREIYRRHKTLKKFFQTIVGLDEVVAEEEACKIEHYLNKDTIHRILKFTEANTAQGHQCRPLRAL